MTYANGPLQRDVQSAHLSRRMVRASAAVAVTCLSSDGPLWSSASANARSIARMTLRHLFPGFGSTAPAKVWNIQNTLFRYSTTYATLYAALRQGVVLTLQGATAKLALVVPVSGLSPYGRVVRS